MPDNTQVQIVQSSPFDLLIEDDFDRSSKSYQLMQTYVQRHMIEKIDYGLIQGCGNQKILFKPGAEKLAKLFCLTTTIELVDKQCDYSAPLFHYHYKCSVYRDDRLICQCEASANSKESKFLRTSLVCPHCKSDKSVIKDRYNEGFYLCYQKKGGCGAKNLTRESLNGQTYFSFDAVNSIVKLAQKRAYVGAIKMACGATKYFFEK